MARFPQWASNRILGVSTAQCLQVEYQAQLQATRLDAEGADHCCFGIEQSIFAAPHTPRIRLLSNLIDIALAAGFHLVKRRTATAAGGKACEALCFRRE